MVPRWQKGNYRKRVDKEGMTEVALQSSQVEGEGKKIKGQTVKPKADMSFLACYLCRLTGE